MSAAMTEISFLLLPHPCIQRFIIRSRLLPKLAMEVGPVIKKQDDPDDDMVPALTEIITEILRNIPGSRVVRVKGFFRGAPCPSVPPRIFRLMGDNDHRRLPFERIESEDFIFITARLASHLQCTPHVEIMQDALHVFIDERVAIIILHTPVDVDRSHYTVHNGILDITVKKIKKT
jgi:hypothetical protein